jgi:putative transposase
VFFGDDDRRLYLSWLKGYCDDNAVEVLAYCLMTNHVHLVAVPGRADGLERALKPLHMRYAQRINRQRGGMGISVRGGSFPRL